MCLSLSRVKEVGAQICSHVSALSRSLTLIRWWSVVAEGKDIRSSINWNESKRIHTERMFLAFLLFLLLFLGFFFCVWRNCVFLGWVAFVCVFRKKSGGCFLCSIACILGIYFAKRGNWGMLDSGVKGWKRKCVVFKRKSH